MTDLDVLLAVAGLTVTVLVVAGMILITPRGAVDAFDDVRRRLVRCTSPSRASCSVLWRSGALSSDQRACLTQRPAVVLLLPWVFHSARRTWSTASPASRTTWKGSNATWVGHRGPDGLLVAAVHVDRDRPDGAPAVAQLVKERLQPVGVAARSAPHDRACGVIADEREVALPAPVGDLVHTDGDQPGKAPLVEPVGDHARDDRPDGVPTDAQEPADRRLGHLLRQEGDRSSKSRVWRAPVRAHGTASTRTPQSRQATRRSRYSTKQRWPPTSRWRQRRQAASWAPR